MFDRVIKKIKRWTFWGTQGEVNGKSVGNGQRENIMLPASPGRRHNQVAMVLVARDLIAAVPFRLTLSLSTASKHGNWEVPVPHTGPF